VASLSRFQSRHPKWGRPCTSSLFTLRCTQKLLDRLKAEPEPDVVQADTVLGDWYANLVRAGRAQVVLAVSERTLLPVVLAAKDGRSIVQRLSHELEPVLLSVGVPPDDATAECRAMQRWVFGKTADRRVLGSLNDLVFQLQVGLTESPERTLLAQSLWLAKTPLKVIDHGAPDQATAAAFATRRELARLVKR
jgi:hypothetical protein